MWRKAQRVAIAAVFRLTNDEYRMFRTCFRAFLRWKAEAERLQDENKALRKFLERSERYCIEAQQGEIQARRDLNELIAAQVAREAARQ